MSFSFPIKPGPVVIGGPSGVGKTSIVDDLIALGQGRYARPASVTSRQRRPGEADTEYEFLSDESVRALEAANELVNCDEVYGHLYGVRKGAIDLLLSRQQVPLKEIHPQNHHNFIRTFPGTLRVLLSELSSPHTRPSDRSPERAREDHEYYSQLTHSGFDIILHMHPDDKTTDIAEDLDCAIRAVHHGLSSFPRPPVIDTVNREGYSRIAAEFSDAHRITTRAFHSLTLDFLRAAINDHCRPASDCVELGVGTGWLQENITFSRRRLIGVDLSSEMLASDKVRPVETVCASVRATPFPRSTFDIALASLADGFCYPAALVEVRRILRPGGVLIITCPSSEWSDLIRPAAARHMTEFVPRGGGSVHVYSFTCRLDDLGNLLQKCGFAVVQSLVKTAADLNDGARLPPAIATAVQKAGFGFSIMNCVVCKKTGV
jgi:guanylate kinase/ubiquinone/menaquinone biosynthesis C-methylase UbiE